MNPAIKDSYIIFLAVIFQSIFIFLYSIKRRKLKSALLFAAAQAFMVFSLTFLFIDYLSVDYGVKSTFYYMYRFMLNFLVPTYLIFVLDFIGKEKWLFPRKYLLLFIVPAAVNFIICFYPRLYAKVNDIGNASFDSLGLWYWIGLGYIFLLVSLICIFLFDRASKTYRVYRKQSIALFTGAFIQIAAIGINVAQYIISFPAWLINNLPLIYLAACNIAVFYAVFKAGMLDLKPIARNLVIDNLKFGLLTIDNRDIVVDINPMMETITGKSFKNIVGNHLKALSLIWENLQVNKELLDKGENCEFIIQGNQENIIYEMNITKIAGSRNETAGHLIILNDITIRKKEEEILKNLLASRNKIFSIIGHDLRNPFTSMTGYLKILLNHDGTFTNEERKEIITKLSLSSNKVSDLLENLLEWTLVQNGALIPNKQCVPFLGIIEEIKELFSASIKEKSISIKAEVDENFEVYVDKFMLSTIIRNLVSNAIKFSNPGGAIFIIAEKSEKLTTICVNDNGIGIDELEMQSLFKIEKDISSRRINREKGTGLGLILCKEFVEMNGGSINVKSNSGIGSEFIITLPNN